MQLKSIKLVGFKSFVDPTTIHINHRINGIVGPNGCGKSNVIDAVRWVIGERSAKQLRGQSMADVIFNGTSTRKPVGRASVELIFDNSDGTLSGEFAKFTEISVKREVFREGQSNYYMNGTKCRRQDIIDLFYGTGLGSRSYAIIEQGMISRLIEAKPEEMRAHVEEAAGVAKYKQRRRDTENRMNRTQENLNRLTDVREELEKQLRHLKRQAGAAERYQVLKKEERQVHAEIKALHWQALQADIQKQEEKISERDNMREKLQADYRNIETALEKARLDQIETTDQHNLVQKDFYSIGADVARIEQQIHHTQEQIERWQSELTQTNERWQSLSDSLSEYDMQIEELQRDIEHLQPQADALSENYQAAASALILAEQDMQTWNSNWDIYQSQYTDSYKTLEVSRAKLKHYQDESGALSERIARLKANCDTSQQTALLEQMHPLNEQMTSVESEQVELNTTLETLLATVSDRKRTLDDVQKEIHHKRQAIQVSEGRKSALEALQEAAFEANDKSVDQWLDTNGLKDHPRLGKDLQVEQGWELAVETVLNRLFDAVCVTDLDGFINNFTPLKSGELMLIEQGAQSNNTHSNLTTLASKVTCNWPTATWLNNVFVADTFEQAKSLRHQLADDQSIITRDGVWLGKHWLRLAKAVNDQDSVLLREQSLKTLTAEIETLKEELSTLEESYSVAQDQLSSLENQRETTHQTLRSLNQTALQLKSQITEKQTRHDELTQRAQMIATELAQCDERYAVLQGEICELLQSVSEFESMVENLQSQKESLLADKRRFESVLHDKRDRAQITKQQADEHEIRLTSNQNQLAVLQQTMSRDQEQLAQLDSFKEELTENLDSADSPLETLRDELQLQLTQRSQLDQKLSQTAEALTACNEQILSHEKGKDETQLQINQLQEVFQQLQMDKQALTVRQLTICEQLEEHELTVQAVIETLADNAVLSEWEERSEKLASKISRLGSINLAAIEEHDALLERKTYLDQQHADLDEALDLLKNAIHKIDKETRSKFRETFDKVNTSFAKLFPKVFGGGSAYIELDNEDILSAGILVKAQPPGKRNATIHMLSGGEKALTAIALIFSLFELNPAPFCILDEVDAPLDDLNVGRYCNLIREMSTHIQFIVISHNKVTIESADCLMGVTMQEPGASRMVTVDIEEAVTMAEV